MKTQVQPKQTKSFTMLTKFKEGHPDRLFTLEEVAEFCGRTHQLLRHYYSQGLLPEPKHSIKGARKTARKFTIDESKQLRAFFLTQKNAIEKIRTFKERNGVVKWENL
jgi:hypothetical protein